MGWRLGNMERMTARPWVTAPLMLWVLLFLALMVLAQEQQEQVATAAAAAAVRAETGARYEPRHRAQTQGRQRTSAAAGRQRCGRR